MKTLLKKSWPFLLLAVLSFTLHFAFLSYPAQVVFDEVHFGKFVAAYSTGQYYFDIHPPLGKMLIAGFAKLAGANPVFDFAQIGQALPADTLFALRFLPAFFGSIFVLFFAWLAYLMFRDKPTALLAGFFILLDNAFLVQSKFILVDIFMLCFEILTLCFFFLWQRQTAFRAKWFTYLTLTGIFAGLTISVKWTGVAVIGIMGVILLVKVFSEKLNNYLSPPLLKKGGVGGGNLEIKNYPSSILPSSEGRRKIFIEAIFSLFIIIFISFTLYLIPFWLHFQLLPDSGPGDAFMSPAFQQELKYGRDNVSQPLSFWQKFIELNKTMYTANANLTAKHPFESKWYSWPVNNKPVYYWNQESFSDLPGRQAKIYLFGNPVLWPLAGLGVIFGLLALLIKKIRRQLSPALLILLLAYFANLLPFILIKRAAFLYHYLPAVMYAILLLAFWLNRFWPKEKRIFITTLCLILLGFIVIAPISYGCPLSVWPDRTETRIIDLFN